MKLNLKLYRPKRFKNRGETCLNCKHPLDISDRFCSYCGQKNSNKPLDAKELFLEFFSGLLAYDSRFRKTIAALVLKPGKLSKEYILGKRISYVNPFRFFISTAIIFFLVLSWINRDQLNQSIQFSTLEEQEENSTVPKVDLGVESSSTYNKFSKYIDEHPETTYSKTVEALGMEEHFVDKIKFDFIVGYKRIIKNPISFINYLLPKLPFFLFFFIPVFTLFSTLLYVRNKTPFTHHLIFNYNQQTVFLMLLFFSVIIDFIGLWIWLLVYAFYLFKSMKNFYQQSIGKTLLKQCIISIVYVLSSVLVLTSLAVLSIVFF